MKDIYNNTLNRGDTVMIPNCMKYTWVVTGFRFDEAKLQRLTLDNKQIYYCPCDKIIKTVRG